MSAHFPKNTRHFELKWNICQTKNKNRSIDRTICVPHNHLPVQSPDSCTSSWSTVSPPRHFSSFLFHFPCTPITNQSDRVHFSPLRGWMKIKSKATWSTRGIICFDSWWLGVWCFSAACLLGGLPTRLPVCSFPSPSNGELQSARSDTVKPSGMADYGAKYWSLPHMCQNSPHPLIRISPSRHTGTNRIY